MDKEILKREIAKLMGIADKDFDFALPQNWLNWFTDDCKKEGYENLTYEIIRSTCFTLYTPCLNVRIISALTEIEEILKGIYV